MSQSNGQTPQHDLSEQLKHARQRLELAQINRRLELLDRSTRRRNLRESAASEGWSDFVGAYGDLVDRFRGPDRDLIFPVSTAYDRRYGANWPFWRTWQDHARIRASSRVVVGTSPLAHGVLNAITSYVVGSGMMPAVSAAHPSTPPRLVKAIKSLADDFYELNEFTERQQEFVFRDRRDGEVFWRLFAQGDGRTFIRTVEPEHVVDPPDIPYDQSSFGIITDPDDLEDVRGYWIAYDGAASNGEAVPGNEIVHSKCNVDRVVKRGMPDYAFDTLDLIKTASRLIENIGQGAAIQAAIAFVRQHAAADSTAIANFVEGIADYTQTEPFNGASRQVQRYEPGTVLDMDSGQTFVATPFGQNIAGFQSAVQVLLRALAVKWNAPEWITSADASNGNFASSLVSESPFVRTIKRFQEHYAKMFLRVLLAALRNRLARRGLVVGGKRYDWKVIQRLVKIAVTPTSAEVRDRNQEASRDKTYTDMGVKSPQLVAEEQGIDYERVQRDLQEVAKKQQQQQPPQAPGQGGQPGQSGPGQGPTGGDDDGGGGLNSSLASLFRESIREACIPNKAGPGHHDSETGRPCSPDGGGSQPGNSATSGLPASKASTGYRAGLGEKDQKKTDKLGSKFLGKNWREKIPSLVGAPDDSSVSVSIDPNGLHLWIEIDHPDFAQPCRRRLSHDGAKLYMKNDIIDIKPSARGKGLGTRMFAQQVAWARANGVAYIEAHAARYNSHGESYFNGYSTWPRLGYDSYLEEVEYERPGDSSKAAEAAKRFGKDGNPPPPPAETVQDVMSTAEGRAWWKENGFGLVEAKFDLREGSRSMRILELYLDELAKKAAPVKESAPGKDGREGGEEIDLNDAEEEALEAAWERLDKEGKPSSAKESATAVSTQDTARITGQSGPGEGPTGGDDDGGMPSLPGNPLRESATAASTQDTARITGQRLAEDDGASSDLDAAEALANLHAAVLNALEDAGEDTESYADSADRELDGSGWNLAQRRDGTWHAVRDTAEVKEARILEAGGERSPKGGVTLGGKFYRGGMFIPGKAIASASPEDRKKLDAAKAEAAEKTSARSKARQAAGPVDRAALADRLSTATKGRKLLPSQERSASASWRMLQQYHGDEAMHRVKEIADAAETALAKLPEDHPSAVRLRQRLGELHHMMSLPNTPIGRPAKPQSGKVYNAKTGALKVDPERFQYKLNTDKSGVTQELKSVKTFNPDFAGVISVWRDPADGQDYVVNGHHRHELASRLGHPELAVRYIDAKDAKQARAIGALVNIAEGRGTAIDAAKFMRDTGVGVDDLEKRGVSLRGKLATDAAALTRLSDRQFDRLARGMLDEGKALAVARHLGDHALQDQLFGMLDRREEDGKDLSLRVIEEMAREMAETPKTTKTEKSLFGDIESEESLFVPRNEIKAHVRNELAREVGDFMAVSSKRRADRVSGAGNVLDTEKSREIAAEAERAKNTFDQLVNSRGAISDAINAAAEEYSKAKTRSQKDDAKRKAVDAAREAVRAELEGKPPERAGEENADRPGGETAEPDAADTPAADAGRGDSEPAGLKQDEPGFTGTDAQGREWVNGELKAKQEEQPTARPVHHSEDVTSALARYDGKDSLAGSKGALFGGDDSRSREGFARLPDGAEVVITEGPKRGRTGRIRRMENLDGSTRSVVHIDGDDQPTPMAPTAVEPLQPHLSWRTEAGAAPKNQGGLFGGGDVLPTGQSEAGRASSAAANELNALARSGKDKATISGVPVERLGVGRFRVTVNGKPLEGDQRQAADWIAAEGARLAKQGGATSAASGDRVDSGNAGGTATTGSLAGKAAPASEPANAEAASGGAAEETPGTVEHFRKTVVEPLQRAQGGKPLYPQQVQRLADRYNAKHGTSLDVTRSTPATPTPDEVQLVHQATQGRTLRPGELDKERANLQNKVDSSGGSEYTPGGVEKQPPGETKMEAEPIHTKTSGGAAVVMTPRLDRYGSPSVSVGVDHPTLGKITLDDASWGVANRQGQQALIGTHKGQRVALGVPRADYDRAIAAAGQIKQRQVDDIKSGKAGMSIQFQQGSPLSGHAASGHTADLLKELGLARDVSGWGTHVDPRVEKELGSSFTYEQAKALSDRIHAPARDAAAKVAAASEARRETVHAEAKRTGQKQLLSTDLVGESDSGHIFRRTWVHPDGTTSTTEFRE